MKTIKFHNKTVAINRVRIGVVISNTDGTWWGHIVGFHRYEGYDGLDIKWDHGIQQFEDPLDLAIWE